MKIGSFNINLQRVAIFAGIAVLLFFILDFNSRMDSLTRLQNEAATVRAQATAVIITQVFLQTQVAYATSPAVVDEWARQQAGMAQPGDNVIVPVPLPGVTPLPTPSPTPNIPILSPWEKWMLIFFGE